MDSSSDSPSKDPADDHDAGKDIAAVSRIDAVQKILEVVCHSTGMGFSAVARVTDKQWIACAVLDGIGFGLVPGGELELESTICHEIRQSGEMVVIDDVARDPAFYAHATPARYGFKSYISVPIILPDGQFFGTLCAIDPRPARINTPAIVGMFKLFADLIAVHLDNERRRTVELATEAALAVARLRSDSALLAGEVGTYHWEIPADRVFGDRNFARIFGVRLDNGGALPIAAFLAAIHDEDRSGTVEKIREAVKHGDSFEAEYRIMRGGNLRWVIARGRVERDESGKAVRFPGVVVDVTDRRRAEEERSRAALALARSEARQAYVVKLADALRPLEDPIQVQAVASGVLGEHLHADRVAYFEIVGEDYVVERDYVTGVWSLAGRNPVAAWGQSIVDRLLEGRTVIEKDAPAALARSDEERKTFADWHIGALVSVPLVKDGKFVAGLTVHSAKPRVWTEDEVALIEQTAERTWASVERARALRSVGQSEGRLRALVTASSDVVYRMNAEWTERRQLLGREFNPDAETPNRAWMNQYIHPDDQAIVRVAIAKAIAEKANFNLEHRVLRGDGTVGWTTSRAVPLLDAGGEITEWIGAASDITDRKRVDADLAFQRHQLELIFRDSPASMALWRGEDLIFDQLNPGYQNLFPNRPLLGLPLLEALPELRGQGFDDLLRNVLHTGQPIRGAETLVRLARTSDGPVEDCYFDFSYFQVCDPAGNPWGVYNHAVDVTDRVLARKALEKSREELSHALSDRENLLNNERLARADAELAGKMKDEFLATLSHELRTPLNAIVGWTQILKTDPGLSGDQSEGLEVIDRNARAQTRIIEDILDMSRIISGKLRLDVRRVDLATVVRAGIDTVQPAADAKGVRLQVLLDPAAGPVTGDPGRLHQVFWNLLSNAVKFTPRGGRVQVMLERVNSHIEVSVTDTGEGIEQDFLPHVFDRFRQADASTTRRHGGLGLGLAIVKQLVELHGGAVRVKSAGRGQGATFSVELPLIAMHAEPDEPGIQLREHPAAQVEIESHRLACDQLVGLKVVAVDDEADAVGLVSRLLNDCGAIVRTASSAGEALALITAEAPGVLISDIGMPGEDGYSLMRQVRSLPPEKGGRVPALALTAYARSTDRMKALEAGFQMHLAKPVEPAELIVTVAALAKLTK